MPQAVVDRQWLDRSGVVVVRHGGTGTGTRRRVSSPKTSSRRRGGQGPNGTVIVATGRTFPDALSGSVLSAVKCWPMLLRRRTLGTCRRHGRGLARRSRATKLVIGVDKVVSADVFNALPTPSRVGGRDRYDTSAAVADWAETEPC